MDLTRISISLGPLWKPFTQDPGLTKPFRKAQARPGCPSHYIAFVTAALFTTCGTVSIFMASHLLVVAMGRASLAWPSADDAKSRSTSPHVVSAMQRRSLGDLLSVA